MKDKRETITKMYINQGKMADPDAQYTLGEQPKFVPECMQMVNLY
jgi:hypothetical protein